MNLHCHTPSSVSISEATDTALTMRVRSRTRTWPKIPPRSSGFSNWVPSMSLATATAETSVSRFHPDLVRRIVVSGANLRAGLPQDELQVRQHWSAPQLTEFLMKFEQRLPPSFRTEYQAVTPDGAAHWSVVLAKSYRLWLTPVVMDSADLAAIRAPVLVIAGDSDFPSIEETAEIFRGLRNARLFIVPGAGHGTFSDQPELVNLAIRQFLDAP